MVDLTSRRLGLVSTMGSPPSADTLHSPVPGSSVAKTMVLSSPQLAPSGLPVTGPSVITGPPDQGHLLDFRALEEANPPAVW